MAIANPNEPLLSQMVKVYPNYPGLGVFGAGMLVTAAIVNGIGFIQSHWK